MRKMTAIGKTQTLHKHSNKLGGDCGERRKSDS